MAGRNYPFQVLPVPFLVLKGPAAAPCDPDPVKIRLLEQAEHFLEIAVIDVGQHVLLFRAELFAPPGPFGLPTLDLSAVDPDETKIPLLGPERHVLRLDAIQLRCGRERLRRTKQQAGSHETNCSNAACDSEKLHSSLK